MPEVRCSRCSYLNEAETTSLKMLIERRDAAEGNVSALKAVILILKPDYDLDGLMAGLDKINGL